jgi:hypothetical protein
MTDAMTVDEALRGRWRATGLPTSRPGAAAATATEEVGRLGAVQAQEFETTLWSLGRRTGEARADVLAQFQRGEFVRTHVLRQTWHFVRRDDLAMAQAATAHRVHQRNALQYRQLGLDDGLLQRSAGVVLEALRDGPLTRSEIGERLAAAGIDASGLRLGVLMMWAELECLVVSGPLVGKQHTYLAWGDTAWPDRAEAAAWLAGQFFGSHGPATVDDFVAWSSLTRTQARQAAAQLPLRSARVDGVECLWSGAVSADGWASPQVELLNGYDEYVSGLSAAGKRWLDREGLWRARAGTPIGVVMVDGQLAGHWRRTTGASRVDVEVLPLRRLTGTELAALERHVAAYGEFLGSPTSLTLRH